MSYADVAASGHRQSAEEVCICLLASCYITASPLFVLTQIVHDVQAISSRLTFLFPPQRQAAAPQPPQVVTDESASTSSLVDVDTPSVRTVPSDFNDQDVQTDTQVFGQQQLEDKELVSLAHIRPKKGTRYSPVLAVKADAARGPVSACALADIGKLFLLSFTRVDFYAEISRFSGPSVHIWAAIDCRLAGAEGYLED